MNIFGHTFVWLIVMFGIVFLGYWGFTSFSDSTSVAYNTDPLVVGDTSATLSPADELPIEVDDDLPEFLDPESDAVTSVEEPVDEVPTEYKELVLKLERLITDRVYMKAGSQGTRVGTIQEFLKIFNNGEGSVDNDYGNGTKSRIAAFQTAVGIPSDGEAGPQTYQAMIDWLSSTHFDS